MIQILVVEDDESFSKVVCSYLRRNGFEVKGCLNAADAYEEMYHNICQLIISDIMMPGIDGFEFAKSIRNITVT